MGQKVSPHGLRVGVIKNWDSRWFVRKKDYTNLVFEDCRIRKFLKMKLYQSGIDKIEIERSATRIKINIHCSKPGIVIGKGGNEIAKLKVELENMLKSGINPDIKNNLGETPLYLCLELDNLDAFKLLLNYNADVNIQRNDGYSILHLAITENKKKFIKI